MKYSLLLTGKNRIIKEDFFSYLWEDFECLSCSGLYGDLRNHIRYFIPDALIYCMHEEEQVNMQHILSMKDTMQDNAVPLVLIGDKDACAAFEQYAPGYADLVLVKPISTTRISEDLIRFLDIRRLQKEKEEEQEFEELRKAQEALKKEQKKHILVVDDDPLMLKMMKDQLHGSFDVATAISGKVAMRFLEKKSTDLILLDYEMPEENGPAVLEKLRAQEPTKDIPVVFLTGIVERGKIEKALKLKPQGYLLKPIEHDKLMEAIQKVLG